MSFAWPLPAIACSMVADVPVCSTSRMIRVDDGPMFAIFRSVPSGLSNDSIGSLERQDRRRGALVAPHALLRLLDRREIAQQRRDLAVHVHVRGRARHQLILSPVAAAPSDPIVANARPAATVVVLRDSPAGPEVFMVRRHEGTAFMGGAHVFPGGRVDAADGDADDSWCDGIAHAARQLDGLPPAEAVAYHVAAARELFEEAGVLLARHPHGDFVSLAGAADHERLKQDRDRVHEAQTTLRAVIERERLRLALDALVLFAHWVTPPIDSRQFDTRFFMTRVPPHQTPAHDDTETTHSLWVRPADAIAQAVARRDRPAAADLEHAARARAVRVGRRTRWRGRGGAPSSAACRRRSSRTATACCCCPAIRCIPIPPATTRRSRRGSC